MIVEAESNADGRGKSGNIDLTKKADEDHQTNQIQLILHDAFTVIYAA